MQLQFNRQDGAVWIGDGERSVEIHPTRLDVHAHEPGAAGRRRRPCSTSGSAHPRARSSAARARRGSPRTARSTRRSATASARVIEQTLRGEHEDWADDAAFGAGADRRPRPVHPQRLSRHGARLRRRRARARRGEPDGRRTPGRSAGAVHALVRLPAVRARRRPGDAGRVGASVQAPGRRQRAIRRSWSTTRSVIARSSSASAAFRIATRSSVASRRPRRSPTSSSPARASDVWISAGTGCPG